MIKAYYLTIAGRKSHYRGSSKRKMFCKINKNRLKEYPFDTLYQEIENHYDQMRVFMD